MRRIFVAFLFGVMVALNIGSQLEERSNASRKQLIKIEDTSKGHLVEVTNASEKTDLIERKPVTIVEK